MRVLVTGDRGYIGAVLVPFLRAFARLPQATNRTITVPLGRGSWTSCDLHWRIYPGPGNSTG